MDHVTQSCVLKFSPSDYIIAVGGDKNTWGTNENDHGKTELFSSSKTWSSEADYPYGTEYSDS